jgi:signal peptidase I
LDFGYEDYIFGIFLNLPYLALFLFLGFFTILTIFRFTESQNGMRVAAITSASMTPNIQPGSLIFTSKKGSYKEGDIITYKEIHNDTKIETKRNITHRIIDTKDSFFITKGDANSYPDPGYVEASKILGEVFLIVPYLGYLDLMVRTFPGFLIFIATPSVLVIRNELKFLLDEDRFF